MEDTNSKSVADDGESNAGEGIPDKNSDAGAPQIEEENRSEASQEQSENPSPNPKPGTDVQGDGDADSDEPLEEIVPELHPDVHRDPFDGYDVSDPEDLADAVGNIDKQASITIERLFRQVSRLEEEAEQFKQKAKKKQQEFQSFKQRKNSETEELRDTATKEFIKDALPIRDNLARALEQDSEDIRSGVELIHQEFDELLEQEGVTIIDPDSGAEVDPGVHEVMTRVDSDTPEGQIEDCFRPGYKMEGVVIRPARVTVSSGNSGD